MNREEAKELFRSDKDAYGKPHHIMKNIDKIYDDFEKEHPLPPAEGAEEILDKYPHSIEYPSFVHENSAIAAMTEFATLHAQRIADKMVEERLRGELIKYSMYASEQWCDTSDRELSEKNIDEYLKTRDNHE